MRASNFCVENSRLKKSVAVIAANDFC